MRCAVSTVRTAQSRLANAVKKSNAERSETARAAVDQARRELAEAKIAAYVDKALAAARPLTDDQRGRLAALLRGAGL